MNIFVILCNLSEFASRFQLALALGQHCVKFSGKKVGRRPPPKSEDALTPITVITGKVHKNLCAHNTFLQPWNEVTRLSSSIILNERERTGEKIGCFFPLFRHCGKETEHLPDSTFSLFSFQIFRRPAWFAIPYSSMMISVKTFGPAEIGPEILSEIEKVFIKLERNGGE